MSHGEHPVCVLLPCVSMASGPKWPNWDHCVLLPSYFNCADKWDVQTTACLLQPLIDLSAKRKIESERVD